MPRFYQNMQTIFNRFLRFPQPLHSEVTAVTVLSGAFDYDTVFSTPSILKAFFLFLLSSRFTSTFEAPLRRNAALPSLSGAFDYDSFFQTPSTVFGFFSALFPDSFSNHPANPFGPAWQKTLSRFEPSLRLCLDFQASRKDTQTFLLQAPRGPTGAPCGCWPAVPAASWYGTD